MSALKALTLASLLLILLAAKPTTPADAGPAPKPDAGVVVDAGPADAGLDRDAVAKRRFKLLMNVNEFKASMEESGAVVKIDEILFATGMTATYDAAIVLGSINGNRLGNFFVFMNDKWTVFPTDFGSESVPPVK